MTSNQASGGGGSRNAETGWSAIRKAAADRSSGAESIAKLAASGLALIASGSPHAKANLEPAIRVLLQGHPGMAPLWRLGEDCLKADDPEGEARRWQRQLEQEYLHAAESAAELIPTGLIITNSHSRTVISLELAARSKELQVICALSDPTGEGARTASELARRKISVQLVRDKEILEQIDKAQALICGGDAVMPHALRNKAGTRDLARRAEAAAIPRYAVTGESKFVELVLPAERVLEDVDLDAFTLIITDAGNFTVTEAAAHARSRNVRAIENLLSVDRGQG